MFLCRWIHGHIPDKSEREFTALLFLNPELSQQNHLQTPAHRQHRHLPGPHSCFTFEPLSFSPVSALHLQVQQTPGVYGSRSFLPHWIRNKVFHSIQQFLSLLLPRLQSDVGQWNRWLCPKRSFMFSAKPALRAQSTALHICCTCSPDPSAPISIPFL